MSIMDTKEKLVRYISLIKESSTLFGSIGDSLHRSQAEGVNGMYDVLDKQAKEMHGDHPSFLKREMRRLNKRRKEDLRILLEAYQRNRDFNKMILSKFGSIDKK